MRQAALGRPWGSFWYFSLIGFKRTIFRHICHRFFRTIQGRTFAAEMGFEALHTETVVERQI